MAEELILELLFGEILKSDSNLFRLIQLGFAYYIIRSMKKLKEDTASINEILRNHIKEDDDFKEEVQIHFRKEESSK